ncbi:MAG: YHYH domain-containing protein [Candidatus Adiutrix sp.]|jgi:hypothetical protein|nr:YHYH domain-containing protein [Candidatus Adiutrix sp.]
MKKLLIALILVVGLAMAPVSLAHSGRTDKEGCHIDKSTGTRHCH